MKLFVFHGPGISRMRDKVLSIKKDFDSNDITELDGKELVSNKFQVYVSQSGLFSQNRLLIIDNPPEVNLEGVQVDDGLAIILKFNKTLPSNSVVLKQLQEFKPEVVIFPEDKEQSIFPFLDLLTDKNPKSLVELDNYLDEWGSQYILTMTVYSLRRLVQRSVNLPPFVLKKLEIQRKNFPTTKIVDLYREILETDFKIKQGLMEEKMAVRLLAQKFLE